MGRDDGQLLEALTGPPDGEVVAAVVGLRRTGDKENQPDGIPPSRTNG